MEKHNYHKELENIISQFTGKTDPDKPTLLLHACCGPCSSYVLEYLASIFNITVYFYNPNIQPEKEYNRRLEELKKFLTIFPDAVKNKVTLKIEDYNPQDYFDATNVLKETELQREPEKGERCRRCYSFRMKKAWDCACSSSFDFFTTTLSISPHKDSEKINTIGKELESLKPPEIRTRFLPADFKKRGGFLRSTQLSSQYGLWRQDYCGCVYSMRKEEKSDE